MKKWYFICAICVVTLGAVVYISAYQIFYDIYQGEPETAKSYVFTPVSRNDEDIIKSTTELVVEKYNCINNTFEDCTEDMSIDILGMNRNQYYEYLKKYMDNPSREDIKAGLKSVELLSFSKETVIIRKYYEAITEDKFFLLASDGKVVIYCEDMTTVYEYTNIEVKYLPEEIQLQVIEGMHIDDVQELYEFLETYST